MEQILVVDDNQIKRYMTTRTLETAGFSILQASSGAEEPISLSKRTIRDLRLSVQKAARTLNFPIERMQELETAVGEAAMNAVVYAQHGTGLVCSNGEGRVQVSRSG